MTPDDPSLPPYFPVVLSICFRVSLYHYTLRRKSTFRYLDPPAPNLADKKTHVPGRHRKSRCRCGKGLNEEKHGRHANKPLQTCDISNRQTVDSRSSAPSTWSFGSTVWCTASFASSAFWRQRKFDLESNYNKVFSRVKWVWVTSIAGSPALIFLGSLSMAFRQSSTSSRSCVAQGSSSVGGTGVWNWDDFIFTRTKNKSGTWESSTPSISKR